ncbi:hypothetical protein M409DRAFT_18131 [Zasmidium cellare ATCC 36951]|uniref:Zinc finger PHD-type domain-containing protein n=1 Tax=Zasmidium cellare ATCC 36951 TaxID=1080233 RepID=A0A6A6CXQ6_ZASCE|nr:uncharacterized protein M409DRAFT_18131 [Zasmidium cellare ATCC 36951]KAF2171901.1 hypothetical protein M409DRAFT_18131 [Zasmidium cellare ATCC 36951]
MPSPVRRSARGQPAVASSTTSSLSSRQDRSTRANNNQKAGTPRSLSSEDASEPPVARRSQRQPAHKEESVTKEMEVTVDNDEEAIDEEEITRCICGQQEYPGPPLSEAFAGIPDAQSEDAGGLFILCDGCTVWQHGGCVGIVEESQSPDKYFCEECRPKQHAVHTDSRGLSIMARYHDTPTRHAAAKAEDNRQKYSLYLPLHPKANRKGSVSKHDDKAKKDRESVNRASVDPSTGKRRGTMRSKEHDDEEEQLQRAIEESRRDAEPVGGTGRRGGKRGRDDSSEDSKQTTKRQRRQSESAQTLNATASIEDESDDGKNGAVSKYKKAKAEAALTARQAEQEKKEKEREAARAEAAGRRQERARSRRGAEEVDVNDEDTPKPSSNKTSPPAPSSQPPTPPPADKAPPKRGPGKKPPKKLGNNQYTKRNFEQAASSPHGRKRQLQSHATASGDEGSEVAVNAETNGSNKDTGKTSPGAPENGNGVGKGKYGRGKKAFANGNGTKGAEAGQEVEKTFVNMHAALTNISSYVTKQQEELVMLGGSTTTSPLSGEDGTLMVGAAVQISSAASESSAGERKFEELSCAEMAAQIQKNIAEWQRMWGHHATTT